jgi:hypothetical protein
MKVSDAEIELIHFTKIISFITIYFAIIQNSFSIRF